MVTAMAEAVMRRHLKVCLALHPLALSHLTLPPLPAVPGSHAHTHLTYKEDEDEDAANEDGIQLAKGYANSSGHVAPTTLVHAERDSLW
jgi:hypothetical protein